jgi:galactokinase
VIVGSPNNGDSFTIVTTASVGSESTTHVVPRDLSTLQPKSGRHWTHYVDGVLAAFADQHPPPCNIVIASSIPLGGGLSSSAALEVPVRACVHVRACMCVRACACVRVRGWVDGWV